MSRRFSSEQSSALLEEEAEKYFSGLVSPKNIDLIPTKMLIFK